MKAKPKVKCSWCQTPKTEEHFSPSNWARGTGVACKPCNSKRNMVYAQRKRAEAKTAGTVWRPGKTDAQ